MNQKSEDDRIIDDLLSVLREKEITIEKATKIIQNMKYDYEQVVWQLQQCEREKSKYINQLVELENSRQPKENTKLIQEEFLMEKQNMRREIEHLQRLNQSLLQQSRIMMVQNDQPVRSKSLTKCRSNSERENVSKQPKCDSNPIDNLKPNLLKQQLILQLEREADLCNLLSLHTKNHKSFLKNFEDTRIRPIMEKWDEVWTKEVEKLALSYHASREGGNVFNECLQQCDSLKKQQSQLLSYVKHLLSNEIRTDNTNYSCMNCQSLLQVAQEQKFDWTLRSKEDFKQDRKSTVLIKSMCDLLSVSKVDLVDKMNSILNELGNMKIQIVSLKNNNAKIIEKDQQQLKSEYQYKERVSLQLFEQSLIDLEVVQQELEKIRTLNKQLHTTQFEWESVLIKLMSSIAVRLLEGEERRVKHFEEQCKRLQDLHQSRTMIRELVKLQNQQMVGLSEVFYEVSLWAKSKDFKRLRQRIESQMEQILQL